LWGPALAELGPARGSTFKAVTTFGVILLYRLRIYVGRYAELAAVALRLLSCTLKKLDKAGFGVVGVVPYYHSDRLKLLRTAPSYFIVALR